MVERKKRKGMRMEDDEFGVREADEHMVNCRCSGDSRGAFRAFLHLSTRVLAACMCIETYTRVRRTDHSLSVGPKRLKKSHAVCRGSQATSTKANMNAVRE